MPSSALMLSPRAWCVLPTVLLGGATERRALRPLRRAQEAYGGAQSELLAPISSTNTNPPGLLPSSSGRPSPPRWPSRTRLVPAPPPQSFFSLEAHPLEKSSGGRFAKAVGREVLQEAAPLGYAVAAGSSSRSSSRSFLVALRPPFGGRPSAAPLSSGRQGEPLAGKKSGVRLTEETLLTPKRRAACAFLGIPRSTARTISWCARSLQKGALISP